MPSKAKSSSSSSSPSRVTVKSSAQVETIRLGRSFKLLKVTSNRTKITKVRLDFLVHSQFLSVSALCTLKLLYLRSGCLSFCTSDLVVSAFVSSGFLSLTPQNKTQIRSKKLDKLSLILTPHSSVFISPFSTGFCLSCWVILMDSADDG